MTAILVATTGGHLTQLVRLAARLDVTQGEQIWVTHRAAQSESMLSGRNVEYVPFIAERDVMGVARSLRHVHGLIERHEPTAIVSTGSAIAVGYLGYAALRGVPSYYIESAARPDGPSRTGRILGPWPRVQTFTQYPRRAGGGWRHVGSVFDDYSPAEGDGGSRPLRVTVTVGSSLPFDRLLRQLVAIAPSDTEFIWQVGESDPEGLPGIVHEFLPAAELDKHMQESDVVVAHAGCGSALAALEAGKAPVLVPRLAAYGEVVDDHQVQIADFLQDRGLCLHRSVSDLQWDDVERAASMAVTTSGTPTPVNLT